MQCGRIRVHGDEALLSAVGKRRGRPLDGCELCSDEVIAKVKELLFAKCVARQTELDHRNRGSGIDDHQRRRSSRRQEAQERLRDSGSLRQRRLNVGVRLEIDLNDGDAVERLRLGVFDVIDQRGDSALDVAGDALFHLLRLEASKGPDETDNGNIDLWKNVGGRAHQHEWRQKDDHEGHHDKRIRPL